MKIIKNGSPGGSRRYFGTRSTKRPKKSLFVTPFGEPFWNENPPKAALDRPKGVLEGMFSPLCAHGRFFFTIFKYFRSSTNLKNHAFAAEGYQKSKYRPSLKESRQAPILHSILNDFRTPQIQFSPQSAPQGRKMTHTV